MPSRRLGRSLGIDIVPRKVCTLDCVYCQVGRSTEITVERKEYVPVEAVISELKNRIARGLEADFITISGSGEPTLNSRLGVLIDEIKRITNIPIAVLTNGTLFFDASVRADCAKADVVLPSLDAGDEQTFEKINRPHRDINIEKLISGLCRFRREYKGQIWLEVFFVEGINTADEQIAKIREAMTRIGPDKVQLNTAVRPTADEGIRKVTVEKLEAIAAKLGPNTQVIADFVMLPHKSGIGRNSDTAFKKVTDKSETLFSVLKRRPCSVDDLCSGLGWSRDEVIEQIKYLKEKDIVISEEKGEVTFFKAKQGA